MAEGGVRSKVTHSDMGDAKLVGDARVTEQLLNQVAKHVYYNKLGTFAKDLGIKQIDYEKITAPNTFGLDDQIYQVLNKWFQKQPLNYSVRRFITAVQQWQIEGYIDKTVWTDLQDKVSHEVLPTHVQNVVSSVPRLKADPDSTPSESKIQRMQKLTRQALEAIWKNCLAHDWLKDEEARKFPLRRFYTQLKWVRRLRGAIKDTMETMTSIFDLLQVVGNKATSILVEGAPGVGKTSSMAFLAMEYVEHLDFPFHFVFLIRLQHVQQGSSLAEIIKAQHPNLCDVPTEYINHVLEGHSNHRVLLILDGYDEYKRGTSQQIDKAIENKIGNCLLILTSRPELSSGDDRYVSKQIRDKMDAEVVIEGFSEENILRCGSLYLDSDEKCNEMLDQARKTGIYNLLHIPIILLMTCVIYEEKNSLPSRQTELFYMVRELIMDRTTQKKLGCKSSELSNLDDLLRKLGELSWSALQSDVGQLLLNKDDIMMKQPDIMLLGLLTSTDPYEAALHQKLSFVSFPHKTLQEFCAADLIARSLDRSQNVKEAVNNFFPSWRDIKRSEEVVVFTCGLMSDPTPLVDHVYEMYIKWRQNKMVKLQSEQNDLDEERLKAQGKNPHGVDIFLLLYRESAVQLQGEPCHNKYVSIYFKDDCEPVRIRSKYYAFYDRVKAVSLCEEQNHEDNYPECIIYIRNPRENATKDLLLACKEISQKQPITDLRLTGVSCSDDINAFNMSRSTRSLVVKDCRLPRVVTHVMQQTEGSSSLHTLGIENTSLQNVPHINLEDKPFLTKLVLQNTNMSEDLCECVCKQLRHIFSHLEVLSLSGNLVGVHGRYLAEATSTWDEDLPLYCLRLRNCQIPTDICGSLLLSLSRCKRLGYLDLENNIISHGAVHLTRSLQSWGPKTTTLQKLSVKNCQIPVDMMGELLETVSVGKHLTEMFLSENCLRGCLSRFVPISRFITKLSLFQTKILEEDISHVKNLIESNRLTKLEYLSLRRNELCQMEKTVFELVQACVTKRMKLQLNLSYNRLSRSFKEKCRSLCEGTNVDLDLTDPNVENDEDEVDGASDVSDEKNVDDARNVNDTGNVNFARGSNEASGGSHTNEARDFPDAGDIVDESNKPDRDDVTDGKDAKKSAKQRKKKKGKSCVMA